MNNTAGYYCQDFVFNMPLKSRSELFSKSKYVLISSIMSVVLCWLLKPKYIFEFMCTILHIDMLRLLWGTVAQRCPLLPKITNMSLVQLYALFLSEVYRLWNNPRIENSLKSWMAWSRMNLFVIGYWKKMSYNGKSVLNKISLIVIFTSKAGKFFITENLSYSCNWCVVD